MCPFYERDCYMEVLARPINFELNLFKHDLLGDQIPILYMFLVVNMLLQKIILK